MDLETKKKLMDLESGIKNDTYTKAMYVERGTLVCFTEKTSMGALYHQKTFEELPSHIQKVFALKKAGNKIDQFKIVAVFDEWSQSFSSPNGISNLGWPTNKN